MHTYQDIQYSTVAEQFEDYVKGIALKKRKEKKSNNKKISLKICTKQGVNLKIRWGNGSPEGLDWVIQHCSLQWCEGTNNAFLCCVLHCGTWYDWEFIFLECLRGGESLSLFPDCHLVMGDFMHHDKACISASTSRLCHWRCCSMSLTLDVFRCLLVTYIAALHWTISIKCQI